MAKQNKKLCGSQGNANINVSLLYNHQTGENFKKALALIAGGENGLWIFKFKKPFCKAIQKSILNT